MEEESVMVCVSISADWVWELGPMSLASSRSGVDAGLGPCQWTMRTARDVCSLIVRAICSVVIVAASSS